MTTNDLNKYQTVMLPYKEIFSDDTFNCRGAIDRNSVLDLAEDIRENTLQQPIMVRSYKDPKNPDIKYRIITGHRRHAACGILRWKEIPCFIRNDLSALEERITNFTENVKRKQLDLIQEAEGIRSIMSCGIGINSVAQRLGVGRGWVEQRIGLWRLPRTVQDDVRLGLLSKDQIQQLVDMSDGTLEDDVVIREAKKYVAELQNARKLKKHIFFRNAKKEREALTKLRSRDDIGNMFDVIYEALGDCAATKVFAYVMSQCPAASLLRTVKEEAKYLNPNWQIPDYYLSSEARERSELGLPPMIEATESNSSTEVTEVTEAN